MLSLKSQRRRALGGLVVLLGESEGKDTADLGQMRFQWGWNRLCAMFMESQGLS